MPYRIHKVLGYALNDLNATSVTDESQFDPRLTRHPDVISEELFNDSPDEFRNFVSNFEAQAEDRAVEVSLAKMALRNDFNFQDALTCELEMGFKTVLMIKPPSHDDWARRDDPIDYQEAFTRGENAVLPTCIRLKQPLYPYRDYMDRLTGRSLFAHLTEIELLYRIKSDTGVLPETDARLIGLKQMGYDTVEEFEDRVVPSIPMEVRLFCKWKNIFVDERTCLDLRPMLYTYWG